MPTPHKTAVLLVEDDERDRKMLHGALRDKYKVEVAVDFTQAKEKIAKSEFDLAFLDLMLPRRQGEKIDESGKFGLDLIRIIREQEPLTPIVVISGLASVKTAMKVLQEGIVDFIVKDDIEDQLPVIMRRADLIRQGRVEQLILRHESRSPEEGQKLVFKSEAMQQVMNQVATMALKETSVLILGETGTGKEVVAREIHARSPRAMSPFVAVNCGAFPESLIESELFGHEKDAFTGASKRKLGLIELANQGTLFLDEIADLPVNLQVKLLRVLQERTFRRIGSEKELPVNIRVISATNKDLKSEIAAGRFREDLFYRLAVARLDLPPLRARTDDIEILAGHFIEKYSPGSELQLSPKLVRILKSHAWPGNVRELENVIQRMLMNPIERGKELQSADVNGYLDDSTQHRVVVDSELFDLFQIEKLAIVRAMERFGTQVEARKRLGISESQLRRKIKEFGFEPNRAPKISAQNKRKSPQTEWHTKLLRPAGKSTEYTTQEAMAALGGVSRKTAVKHLNKLTEAGELDRVSRGNYRRLTAKK